MRKISSFQHISAMIKTLNIHGALYLSYTSSMSNPSLASTSTHSHALRFESFGFHRFVRNIPSRFNGNYLQCSWFSVATLKLARTNTILNDCSGAPRWFVWRCHIINCTVLFVDCHASLSFRSFRPFHSIEPLSIPMAKVYFFFLFVAPFFPYHFDSMVLWSL